MFIPDGKDITLIPKSLINSIKNLAILKNEKYSLCKNDINFINNIKKRYPFDYEFLLKISIKIAKYRTAIYKYPNAKIIIVGSEYSYTSSILTEWCHNNGLKHINIMHGEKLFFIRDSFFYFDKCYVWDDFYKKLFMNLRAPYQQFIIDKPPGLKFTNNVKVTKSYDYTYYLQGFETPEDLKKILEFLLILAKGTLNVSIRPHPRYSDLSSLVKIFDNKINVEDNIKISIEESIMRTKNVISLYSTVLTQAFYNDINIIIDDVSNKTRYEKLEKLQYRFIRSERCRKLSEVIKENKNG